MGHNCVIACHKICGTNNGIREKIRILFTKEKESLPSKTMRKSFKRFEFGSEFIQSKNTKMSDTSGPPTGHPILGKSFKILTGKNQL